MSLRQVLTVIVYRTLIDLMFHEDWQGRLKAIEKLNTWVEFRIDFKPLEANLDLVLKWITVRLFETNVSVLLRALDYLKDVLLVLAADHYSLHDIEAASLIPNLIYQVIMP